MPPPQLATPSSPIALRPEYITTAPTTLRVKQRDISAIDFSVSPETSPSDILFTTNGTFLSWSQKRTFFDSTNLPLFDLHKTKSLGDWSITTPESEDKLVHIKARTSALKYKYDVEFVGVDGQVKRLEVRGKDIWRLRTDVLLDGEVVATVKRTDKFKVYLPGSKLEWVVDVAPGMDMLLASAITVVLGATVYESSISGSSSSSSGVVDSAAAGGAAGGST